MGCLFMDGENIVHVLRTLIECFNLINCIYTIYGVCAMRVNNLTKLNIFWSAFCGQIKCDLEFKLMLMLANEQLGRYDVKVMKR